MRVALVSPYSWTYPGGVTRHIEALAGELLSIGHDVRVLAPYDHDDRRTAWMHRGTRPQRREMPEWLIPLGPTIGWPSNGAVSNLAPTPSAISTLRRELRAGQFDVVHLHEPVAPVVGWDALTSTDAPLVGTFHCYSERRPPHAVATLLGARRKLNRLAARIAVSEAAAWTGRRFYGGEYRIVPNGVALPDGGVHAARLRAPGAPLEIVFVGQAVERKGLPVLLRAFEALRDHVPAHLTIVGASESEVAPLLVDRTGVTILGRVSDAEKQAALERADVLAAPSLGGESFGMVLTEGFAAGTPVVASDIAGYRDVVSDGVDGILFPRGDATALAETLRDLALDPARTHELGTAAARQRRALRLAQGGGAGRGRVPRRDRRAAAGGRRRAHRGAARAASRRPRSAPARPAAPVARAGPGRERAPWLRDRAPRRRGRRRPRGRGRRVPRAPAHRPGPDRPLARDVEPRLGARRPGDHVPLDALPCRLLARDPQGRAAGCTAAPGRRLAGHRRRRAHVRDAAGPPRRAVARADRRPPARATARPRCRSSSARSSPRRCSTCSRS